MFSLSTARIIRRVSAVVGPDTCDLPSIRGFALVAMPVTLTLRRGLAVYRVTITHDGNRFAVGLSHGTGRFAPVESAIREIILDVVREAEPVSADAVPA